MEGMAVTLEEALQEHEERVDALIKSARKYESALKGWKKACREGHIANRQKQAALAAELSTTLADPTTDASESWDFDVRSYLESPQWREDVRTAALERHELRVIDDGDELISSPVVVRAQPARNSVQIGKVNWQAIRPQVVAAELKRLRDRTAAANSQDFLESLYQACKRLTRPEVMFVKFRDVFDMFCVTPGYKKENPRAAFGQQIYALHRSGIRTTKAGVRFDFDTPSGHPKESDIFTVISEDGQTIRYYGITFR
jgi:hypothetical protein